MPVSVSNTTYGIIKDAMVDAGYLQEGSDPNSEQLSIYMRRLCDIINLWQTQGLKLFLLEEISVTLVAGTSSYAVNPASGIEPHKNMRVIQGRVQNSTMSRPINAISWDEWNKLQRTNQGAITAYMVDKQVNSMVVHVWNTPDTQEATNTLVLLVQVQADNPYNLLADVQFPQEWRIALRWGLADDICTGQPQAIMDRCSQRAEIFKEMLENWDVEDAPTRFTPSSQGYATRSFR